MVKHVVTWKEKATSEEQSKSFDSRDKAFGFKAGLNEVGVYSSSYTKVSKTKKVKKLKLVKVKAPKKLKKKLMKSK